MFNLVDTEFNVERGMRIAQLILERYEWTADIKEVEDLEDTERGDGGYGSTGLKAKVQDETVSGKENKGGNDDGNSIPCLS